MTSYDPPKFYDCEVCVHSVEDGCEILSGSPPNMPSCPFFEEKKEERNAEAAYAGSMISRAVRRRANELYASYSETILGELTVSDWEDSIMSSVNLSGGVRKTVREIKSFGANGIEIECPSCRAEVELDGDTFECPECGLKLN